MIIQETSDNVQGFEDLGTRLTNLQPILLKVNETETDSADVVILIAKLEEFVSYIH